MFLHGRHRIFGTLLFSLHRNDVPIEYCGEEQSIVAVGLAAPKPHVFVEAIHHLLVVCTTVEVCTNNCV